MANSFSDIAEIISKTGDIPIDDIKPETHIVNDLKVDSLDFLDIVFAIDKMFGIKVPIEEWTDEVNSGRAPSERYFVMGNLCKEIDALIAAKQG